MALTGGGAEVRKPPWVAIPGDCNFYLQLLETVAHVIHGPGTESQDFFTLKTSTFGQQLHKTLRNFKTEHTEKVWVFDTRSSATSS